MIYKHNETGSLVRLLGIGTYYTVPNGIGSILVAIYCPDDDGHDIFVMDQYLFEGEYTILAEG